MKKTAAREELLMSQLHKRGKMSIKDITQCFNVSEPTARRIATSLAEKNKVLRTHGGIRYIPGSEFEYSFDTLENKFVEEKRKIGKYASSLIKDNDIIFLEAGTTIQHLSMALAERLRNKELKNLIIFTNSLNNLNFLSSLCKVTVIGGEYRPERRDFSGYISEKMLKYLSFSCCFLGADAIDLNEGIMASDIETVRFDELLVTRSEKSIILADSSKFNRLSFVSYASINEISMIVTDNKLSLPLQNEYKNSNVNLVCVED